MDILSAVLLGLALVYQPAAVGCGGQPARTLLAALCCFTRQLIGAPGILGLVTMLKEQRRVVEICRLRCLTVSF